MGLLHACMHACTNISEQIVSGGMFVINVGRETPVGSRGSKDRIAFLASRYDWFLGESNAFLKKKNERTRSSVWSEGGKGSIGRAVCVFIISIFHPFNRSTPIMHMITSCSAAAIFGGSRILDRITLTDRSKPISRTCSIQFRSPRHWLLRVCAPSLVCLGPFQATHPLRPNSFQRRERGGLLRSDRTVGNPTHHKPKQTKHDGHCLAYTHTHRERQRRARAQPFVACCVRGATPPVPSPPRLSRFVGYVSQHHPVAYTKPPHTPPSPHHLHTDNGTPRGISRRRRRREGSRRRADPSS